MSGDFAPVRPGHFAREVKTDTHSAFLIGKETVSMKELIERINSLSAKKLRVDFQGEYPKEHELKKVWTEAPLLPGWEPKLNLNDGIKEYFIGD